MGPDPVQAIDPVQYRSHTSPRSTACPADYTQWRVRKQSNECGSEKRLVKRQWLGIALTVCGTRGTLAVHAATSTARGRTTALPSRDISTIFFQPRAMCRISAQFLSRLNPFAFTGKRIDYFPGRSSNGITSMGTRFSVHVIAHEGHFRYRASTRSSNFWNTITLELRASLLAGDLRFRFFGLVLHGFVPR